VNLFAYILAAIIGFLLGSALTYQKAKTNIHIHLADIIGKTFVYLIFTTEIIIGNLEKFNLDKNEKIDKILRDVKEEIVKTLLTCTDPSITFRNWSQAILWAEQKIKNNKGK